MRGTGIGRDLTEIAGLLAAIALVTMLVKNSRNTSELIKTGADAYSNLLRTATGADYFN